MDLDRDWRRIKLEALKRDGLSANYYLPPWIVFV